MYLPRSFRVEDLDQLHRHIEQYSFGTLFSRTPDGPFATHLPFLLDPTRGPAGTLMGHMARANAHWRGFSPDDEVLVTFLGPHAYISPSWYASPAAVPTWNYAAVHVWGVARLIEDLDALREHVLQMVDAHERRLDPSWDPAAAGDIIDIELRAIIGFEIPIARIEGKYKFNQNRSREDQEGVIAALSRGTDTQLRAVVEIMRGNLKPRRSD